MVSLSNREGVALFGSRLPGGHATALAAGGYFV
jgi:hypothetical protein